MKNKKNLFYFFENIVSYETDVSKIFSKKDNYIPIINSKKSIYIKNKKKNLEFIFANIYIPITIYVLIEIMLLLLRKFKVLY